MAHSLSPAIHNAGFAAAGLDWMYLAFDVAPDRGPSALDAMRTLGISGLSVTMPHKATVAAAVDRLTADAAALGAVNCVTVEGHELVGHNTDGDGFCDSLAGALDGHLDARRVLVIGAGGAARAVVSALGRRGAEVGVVNRTAARAEVAAALAGDRGCVASATDAGDYDVIVNATSIGMAQTPAAAEVPIAAELVGPGHVAVDLVYHPIRTRFLAEAAAAGARTVDGVGMLVHQAARQFSLWTGVDAPVVAMEAAARAAVGRGPA